MVVVGEAGQNFNRRASGGHDGRMKPHVAEDDLYAAHVLADRVLSIEYLACVSRAV